MGSLYISDNFNKCKGSFLSHACGLTHTFPRDTQAAVLRIVTQEIWKAGKMGPMLASKGICI